ncbi:EamA family transporter [Sesbania bispinosa]|nr:EamA family transporter [Sesbania bispinosa]
MINQSPPNVMSNSFSKSCSTKSSTSKSSAALDGPSPDGPTLALVFLKVELSPLQDLFDLLVLEVREAALDVAQLEVVSNSERLSDIKGDSCRATLESNNNNAHKAKSYPGMKTGLGFVLSKNAPLLLRRSLLLLGDNIGEVFQLLSGFLPGHDGFLGSPLRIKPSHDRHLSHRSGYNPSGGNEHLREGRTHGRRRGGRTWILLEAWTSSRRQKHCAANDDHRRGRGDGNDKMRLFSNQIRNVN